MSTDTEDKKPAAPAKIHGAHHLQYMRSDSTMTLRQGIEEYYRGIDGLITADNAAQEVADLFLFHDTCHVLFGCDTSIHGEALVDTWSIFGTTVTLKTYQKYLSLQETKSIFAAMTFNDMLAMLAESTTSMPQAFWRATHMSKKWPFRDHDQHMDRPLNELRAEFGIEVIEYL